MLNDQGTEAKRSIAEEMLIMAERIAGRAFETEERVRLTLEVVCSPECPDAKLTEALPERDYPEYFAMMREHWHRMEIALNRINDTMDRCAF
jgi:hypothetical protein